MFAKHQVNGKNDKKSFLSFDRITKNNKEEEFAGIKIPFTLKCEFCDNKLDNPVKLECSHVFCEKCAVMIFRRDLKEYNHLKMKMKTKSESSALPDKTDNQGNSKGSTELTESHRDIDKKFIGKVLKFNFEDWQKKDKIRIEAIKKGSCIKCNSKLNGIFNEIDKFMQYLEKIKKERASKTLLKKSILIKIIFVCNYIRERA